MQYRLLGNTGLKVSELCFGSMSFGGAGSAFAAIGAIEQEDATEIIAKVIDAGVNFMDTADFYSAGESEIILGKALGKRRKDVLVATKCGLRMGPGPNDRRLTRHHIVNAVQASLRRLQTDYIDLYQTHITDHITPLDETLRALEDLVRSGKVRYVGASNMAAWKLMKALGISEHRGWARYESLQAYYSLAGRGVEREIVPLLLSEKVGMMVWSPLAGGLLTGKQKRGEKPPEGTRREKFDFIPYDAERTFNTVDVMRSIADAHHASMAQVALAWLLKKPVVTSVIIGVRGAAQLEDNLRATDVLLSDEDMARLDAVSKAEDEYPEWMIRRSVE